MKRILDSISEDDEFSVSPRRLWRIVIWAALLLALAILLLSLGRMSLNAMAAYRHLLSLQALAASGFTVQELAVTRQQLDGLANETRQLSRQLRPVEPLLHSLGDRRLWGIQADALPAYLSAGAAFAELTADFLSIVQSSPAKPAQPLTGYLLDAVAAQALSVSALGGRADSVQSAILALDADALPPPWADEFRRWQPLAHFLEPMLLISPSLPALLGYGEAAHYLVLVQNNQEARATGGFISGVALATFEDGQLAPMSFSDSYAVDNFAVAHPAAPPAMQRYLDAPLIFLRDTNWSPDFPISARTVQAVYARDQGVNVKGVVSVDIRALELLLAAIGPVSIPGQAEALTAENAVAAMMAMWQAPPTTDERVDTNREAWWVERKGFMGLFAAALMAEAQVKELDDLAVLAPAVYQAFQERAIQLWIEDDLAAQQLARWGWDGGLRATPGIDYLALIDSNVGFNKVNAVVTRSLGYEVDWSHGAELGAQATVTVTYTHPLEVPGHVCNRRARYGDTYEDMMRRCYFNYVRVYTPRGSELQATTGLEDGSQDSQSGEASTTVFSGYFILKPGETHTIQFVYRLPPTLQPDTYRLILQRQSGSGPLKATWQVAGAWGETVLTENWVQWSRNEE